MPDPERFESLWRRAVGGDGAEDPLFVAASPIHLSPASQGRGTQVLGHQRSSSLGFSPLRSGGEVPSNARRRGGLKSAWAGLNAGYADPTRAYHNWAHIDAMLAGLDAVRKEPEFAGVRFGEIELAIWFHDAIYDPLAKDNEAKSAELFTETAGPNAAIGQAAADRVHTMILGTALHGPSDDISTRLLLDLDLAVLGGTPEAYHRYVEAVRTEYAAVPDDAWKAGRPAVLRRFLERPAIYQTSHFRDRLEDRARVNIAGEIAMLES